MQVLRSLVVAAPLALLFTFTSFTTRAADVVDLAGVSREFRTLKAAIEAAGLVDTLKGGGPFTLFAPSDEAFDKLPQGTVEKLLKPENKDRLVAILTYHVVLGKVMYSDMQGRVIDAETMQGQTAKLDGTSAVPKVNGALIFVTDIEASNGVVHMINSVILPK